MLNVQPQVSFSFGGACSAAHRALAAWCKVEAPLVGSSLGGKLGREIKLLDCSTGVCTCFSEYCIHRHKPPATKMLKNMGWQVNEEVTAAVAWSKRFMVAL